MGFIWSKFIGGFNLFSGAIFGKILHQVIIWIICGAIAWGIWYKVFKQRTDIHNQTAQQITNTVERKAGFKILGLTLLGWEW